MVYPDFNNSLTQRLQGQFGLVEKSTICNFVAYNKKEKSHYTGENHNTLSSDRIGTRCISKSQWF